MGFWCAAPALMALYRQRIDADPKPLEKLVRRFDRQQTFRLTGPEYARSKGQVSDLLRPWYQKKSLSLQCEAPLDQRIFSPQLPQEILGAPPSPRGGGNCRAFCGAVKCGKTPGICRKYLNSVKHGAMIQLSSVRPKARGLFYRF